MVSFLLARVPQYATTEGSVTPATEAGRLLCMLKVSVREGVLPPTTTLPSPGGPDDSTGVVLALPNNGLGT
jgi:hypothetical protein